MSYPQISVSLEDDVHFQVALPGAEEEEEHVTRKRKINRGARARATKKGGKRAAIKKVIEEEVNEEVIEERK